MIIQQFLRIANFPLEFKVVIAATFINQLGNMAIVFLVFYLNQSLHFSLTQSSLAYVMFSAGMLTSGASCGGLVDKFGPPPIMILSLFTSGITFLLLPFTDVYFTILLLCLISGLGYGMYRPAAQTFISQLSSPSMYKITFSCYRLAINLGMSVGPALGSFLAYYSFKFIYIVDGLTTLCACVILFLGIGRSTLLPKPKEPIKRVIDIRWLKNPALFLFLIGMIPVSMVYFQHDSTLSVFLNHNLNFPLRFFGLLFTFNTLLIVFFELPLNIATLKWSYHVNLTLGSLLITGGFAGLYFATQQWHVLVLALIWTTGEMLLYPAASSYIAEIAPELRRGSYMALYSTCSNLGMLLGPWGGAMVMQNLGAEQLWIICGLWGLISGFLLFSLGIYMPQKEQVVVS